MEVILSEDEKQLRADIIFERARMIKNGQRPNAIVVEPSIKDQIERILDNIAGGNVNSLRGKFPILKTNRYINGWYLALIH